MDLEKENMNLKGELMQTKISLNEALSKSNHVYLPSFSMPHCYMSGIF